MNSRDKGKRGERLAAKYLQSLGFVTAKRGQQFAGGQNSPDVRCDELTGVHLEIKCNESLDLGTRLLDSAIEQAVKDCKHENYAVLWRRNRTCWRLTFYSDGPALTVTITGDDDIRHALLYLRDRARKAAA